MVVTNQLPINAFPFRKWFTVPLLFCSLFMRAQQKPLAYPPITDVFPLTWKSYTGSASFRTNPVLSGKYLIMGSNGESFMDYYIMDKGAGVYVLNRVTGQKVYKIASEDFGDMDVNGVLVYNGKIYFGNDNEEFICSSIDGRIHWRKPTSGDVEHEPILIYIHGRPAVVYACESGEVKAVDPQSGLIIWSHYTPDFNGWKPGDNRTVLKVKAFFSNPQSFFTKPVVADLDLDGVADLIYNTYNNKLYAISGATGKCIWEKDWDNAHSFAMNTHHTQTGPVIFLGTSKWDTQRNKMDYFLDKIDRKGVKIDQKHIPNAGGEGLNMISVSPNKTAVLMNDVIMLVSSNGSLEIIDRKDTYEDKDWQGKLVIRSRHSSNSLLASRPISYGAHGNCIIVFNQWDMILDKAGTIEIISLDTKKIVARYSLPCSGEMPPVIDDVNRDGYLDLLINGFDGYTYCFNMKIPAEPRYATVSSK